MAAAQKQHGLLLQILGVDGLALGQFMIVGHRHDEGLVVERLHDQAGFG